MYGSELIAAHMYTGSHFQTNTVKGRKLLASLLDPLLQLHYARTGGTLLLGLLGNNGLKSFTNTAIFVKLSFAIIVESRFIIVSDVRIEIIHIVIGLITAENIYSADIVWPRQKIPLLINLCIYLMNRV